MRQLNILVCINELEKNSFLPAPVWSELETMNANVVLQDSSGMTSEDLECCLQNIRPNILISAWSTPRLPELAADRVLEHLCLLTHLPGSLKQILPRAYLEKGLLVTNWGGCISRTIAECALMLILCCLRRTAQWQLEMHTEGKFRSQDVRFLSLFERKVGIHGFGAIARELIPLLKPFHVHTSAYSPSVPENVFTEHGVHRCNSLEELFANSDVIVELAPDTPKYFHSVTETLLKMIPEDGIFVNCGRGATVDESALIRVAQEGHLQIGLDVYEKEPLPPDSPLRGLKNVCLLPHIGGPTIDRRRDAGLRAIQMILKWKNEHDINEAISVDEYDRAT